MSVDTADVTSPRTGYPYLDAVLDQPGAVVAMAHRGGSFTPEIEGLENTLVAFQHAVDLGYRYLETDVHVTSDGTLLAFHDTVLDRVTHSKGPVSKLHTREVAEALIGGREQIPLLSALLEHLPQVCFNIDIKTAAAAAPLAELIARTKAYDRVCVGSFSETRMRRFRAAMSRPVATAATPADATAVRLLPGDRLAGALTRKRFAVLQVPHRRGPLRVVTAALVAKAHRLGMHVHVWTVDEVHEMHELLDLGVDGLITDRTDVLREVLVERGQWLGGSA